jgi:RHS repeat-associated protein
VELLFYGAEGRLLAKYTTALGNNQNYQLVLTNPSGDLTVYFGGKLVGHGTQSTGGVTVAGFRQDRLGSGTKTFPYGEERAPNGQDEFKFATYWRDTATNLDYAVNRYYGNQWGRFTTPDPYVASGGVGDPGSWNRYAYVEGDPVNYYDPQGLNAEFRRLLMILGAAVFGRVQSS